MKQVIVLSGPVGVGKSAVCAGVIARVGGAGLRVAGAISPPEIVAGAKVGIWIEDVATGAQQRLAVAAHLSARDGKSIQTRRWTFDNAVMAWGAEVIAQACPCDLLVIDELGPLELERGEGWMVAFDVLRAGDYRWALVVVREWLVEKMRARVAHMAGVNVRFVTINLANRDAQPARIAGLITGDIAH